MRGKYRDLFIRMKIRHTGNEKELKIKKKAVIAVCGISYKKLCKFEESYYLVYIPTIRSCNDDETVLEFIKNQK